LISDLTYSTQLPLRKSSFFDLVQGSLLSRAELERKEVKAELKSLIIKNNPNGRGFGVLGSNT